MTSGMSWFVAIVSLVNIAALVWLLLALRRAPGEQATTTETTGHVWDGDLREYNNPLPRWWLWLFIITVIFGLGYAVLYPALGNFAGVLGWSQAKQHDAQAAQNEARLRRTFAPFEGQTVTALASNPEALRIGRNLFANNCASCHGSDARGAPGFPNLTDGDWLWGGSPEAIVETISNGRTGMMMAWGETLGAQGVDNVLAYVLSLSGRSAPGGDVADGRTRFEQICAACHGPDGHGNPMMGAPNLSDQVWLHGGSVETVRATITKGRQGQMPAHAQLLGETRVKLLAAYVLSLGGGARQADAHELAARR